MKRYISVPATILVVLCAASTHAWDYEGHRAINQLALFALPTNFPAFVSTKEARERIAFLAGEPDRWRNITNDQSLPHCNGPDHYLDLEQLTDYGLSAETAPQLRYDLVAKLAIVRTAHPESFEVIDPAKNKDHTRELVGFAPWAITEYCGKLRSAFSYLKAFHDYGGTAEEIANAQANVIYIMGVMGHFVGDCAQPLHVTKHHNGWIGKNPQGYATNKTIHSWIDGGFLRKAGGIDVVLLSRKIGPARIVGDPLKPEDLFRQIMEYLKQTHAMVELVYQMNGDGRLTPENPRSLEGRAFLNGQLVKGGQMLGDLWYSSWQQATEDTYLIRQLKQRPENGRK